MIMKEDNLEKTSGNLSFIQRGGSESRKVEIYLPKPEKSFKRNKRKL